MYILAITLEPSMLITASFGVFFTIMGFFVKSYLDKINSSLAELKNDIRILTNKFDEMKERLVVVETTQSNCKSCNS